MNTRKLIRAMGGLRAALTESSMVHVGKGVFVDKTPEEGTNNVYFWIEWPSLERATWGLAIIEGGPEGQWGETKTVGHETLEPIARYWEADEAVKALEKGSKYAFEEDPLVEVTDEDDYKRAMVAMGLDDEESGTAWEGPGLYDFRDKPPTRNYEKVEDYELAQMEFWNDSIGDSAVDHPDYEKALEDLKAEATVSEKRR